MSILFKKTIKAQSGLQMKVGTGDKPYQLYTKTGVETTPEAQNLNVASVNAAGNPQFSTAANEVGRVLGINAPRAQMGYRHDPKFVAWLNAKNQAKDYNAEAPIGYLKNTEGSEYPMYGNQYQQTREHVPAILGSGVKAYESLGTYYDTPTKYGDDQKFNYGDSERIRYGKTGVTTGGNYVNPAPVSQFGGR